MDFIEPQGWAPPVGYAHGISATGRIITLAGQIGWDPVSQRIVSDDFAAQTRQALANIAAALAAAGAGPEHLVRLTWFITDRHAYLDARREIGAVYRDTLGRNFPPMSVIVVHALVEERAKVEIEATAVVPA
jgi:enamine deaminase RidA (YjgF/YER057c/UK114 family)